jgi:hypothetical protein
MCSAPQGIVCPAVTLQFFAQPACSGLGGSLTIPSGVCQSFLLSSIEADSVLWQNAPPSGGACLPGTNGSSVIPPLVWKETARACGNAQVGGGCGPGVCAPRPQAPFESGACIFRQGDFACPPGPFTQRSVFFQGANDSRSCTQCNCSSPTGATCSGSIELGTNQSCTADPTLLSSPGQCAPLPPDPTPPAPPFQESRSVRYNEGAPTGGSCNASGGQVTGSATATNPVTYCCS